MTGNTKLERCISCGAPLQKQRSDTGAVTVEGRCQSCLREDGSPKSREEVVDAMASYLVRSLDLDAAAARQIAESRLRERPAWRDRPSADRS